VIIIATVLHLAQSLLDDMKRDCFFFLSNLSKMRVAESGFQREAGEGGTKRGEEFSCLLYGIDPFGRLPTYQNGAGIKFLRILAILLANIGESGLNLANIGKY
jgi:GGDEF domain-containing protein